jgi:hypothetical protein
MSIYRHQNAAPYHNVTTADNVAHINNYRITTTNRNNDEIKHISNCNMLVAMKSEEDGSWGKLNDDELHNLHSSPNIVRVIKSRRLMWVGHVARMGEGRGVYRVLVGRPEGKRPLRRPRRRWEDNIKLDLREIGIDGANWIRLAQDKVQWRAFVNTVMNLWVP